MAEDGILVRTATNADREAVWQLILDSFLAIVDSTHESFRPRYDEAGRAAREADLKDIEASYLRSPDSHFWVAESSQHGVVGCVALQRSAADEAKLIRMAVNPNMRGKGVGEKLISTLYQFARAQGYLRIVLVTINKRAANFYKKMGFVSYIERPMDMPPAVE
jgi:N-acetylglutamate synthase-like GNAT family acetyltransferase